MGLSPAKMTITINIDSSSRHVEITDSEGRVRKCKGVFISGGDKASSTLYFVAYGDRGAISWSVSEGFGSAMLANKDYYKRLFGNLVNALNSRIKALRSRGFLSEEKSETEQKLHS